MNGLLTAVLAPLIIPFQALVARCPEHLPLSWLDLERFSRYAEVDGMFSSDPLRLSLGAHLYTRFRAVADRRQARRAARKKLRPTPEHLLTGQRGEDTAFFFLRTHGFTVVARRWHSDRVRGDLDLVAWNGPTLVFVEVKTRTARDLVSAQAAVDDAKQRQLRRLARAWLRQIPERFRDHVPLRFDVLAIYLLPGGAECDHFRAAFPATAPQPSRPW